MFRCSVVESFVESSAYLIPTRFTYPVYPHPEADTETDLQYVRGTGTTPTGLLLHGYNHRRYYACHLTQ